MYSVSQAIGKRPCDQIEIRDVAHSSEGEYQLTQCYIYKYKCVKYLLVIFLLWQMVSNVSGKLLGMFLLWQIFKNNGTRKLGIEMSTNIRKI